MKNKKEKDTVEKITAKLRKPLSQANKSLAQVLLNDSGNKEEQKSMDAVEEANPMW